MSEGGKNPSINDMLFVALVRDFESMALIGFGKLVDPVTQKVERDLDKAKAAIDMLGMLEEKTRGNLDEAQVSLLRQVLTNLRLNYVEEVEKARSGEAGAGKSEQSPQQGAAAVETQGGASGPSRAEAGAQEAPADKHGDEKREKAK